MKKCEKCPKIELMCEKCNPEKVNWIKPEEIEQFYVPELSLEEEYKIMKQSQKDMNTVDDKKVLSEVAECIIDSYIENGGEGHCTITNNKGEPITLFLFKGNVAAAMHVRIALSEFKSNEENAYAFE